MQIRQDFVTRGGCFRKRQRGDSHAFSALESLDNPAVLDPIVGAISMQQNVARVGRRDEALAGESREVLEQEFVARRIELARDIVEQEDRGIPVRASQHRELGGLPREHDGAQLALRCEASGLAPVELEDDVIAMRAELGRLRREIARPAIAELLLERLAG